MEAKVIAQDPFLRPRFCTSATDEYINKQEDGILGTVRNEPPNMSFHRWRRQQGFVTSTPREVVVYNDAPPVEVHNPSTREAVLDDKCEKVETAIEKPRGFNIRIHKRRCD